MEATARARHGERRILLIADLSGYTGYLMAGEADEAPLIAGDLVETMLEQLSAEFEVAGLEGDAAFVHAPIGTLTGEGLLAAIGRSHRAFRQRIESLRQATTCACEACRRVPTLDLKFFVHVGSVVRQRILGRDEIAGRDVILVHRLLKASEPARSGVRRFALITDAAISALRLDPAARGMRRVTQRYEHLGDVVGWTGDPETWGDIPDPRPDGQPALRIERTMSASITEVWNLLTMPELRERWEGIDRIEEESGVTGASRGLGTLSRCVARHLSTVEEVVDWEPPTRFARRVRHGEGWMTVVHELEAPDPDRTLLRVSWHRGGGATLAPAEADEQERRLDRLEYAVSRVSG